MCPLIFGPSTMTTERFTVPVDSDGNIQFTPEMMQQTGWGPGTQLESLDNEDGTVSIFEAESDSEDGTAS